MSIPSTHHPPTVAGETIGTSETLSDAMQTLWIHHKDLKQRAEQAIIRADMSEVTMCQAQNQAIEAEEKASIEVQMV